MSKKISRSKCLIEHFDRDFIKKIEKKKKKKNSNITMTIVKQLYQYTVRLKKMETFFIYTLVAHIFFWIKKMRILNRSISSRPLNEGNVNMETQQFI